MLDWTDIGALATAVGVAFAGWQVALQRTQTRTSFQDAIWREQRDVIAGLPVGLVLAREDDPQFDPMSLTPDDLSLMYRYFDLCNEQAMYAALGRVGHNSWYMWRQAILRNMRRPAFAHAWRAMGPAARVAQEFPYLNEVLTGTHSLAWKHDPLRASRRRSPAV